MDIEALPTFRQAKALESFPHGFFGRRGGVSSGHAASLNVGVGADDDPANIAENRRRIVNALLPSAGLCTLFQVHGRDVVPVEQAWGKDERPHADAMVTGTPGILLGILTADCAPVLFADKNAGVVGAAHAGWKGALAGVTDATIESMEALGASTSNIVAAVGPCIAQRSYEVDAPMLSQVCSENPENERFFKAGRDELHWQFDLEAYVVARLARSGLRQIEAMGIDTYSQSDDYFSYRRSTHLGEPNYGRQISVIGIAAD